MIRSCLGLLMVLCIGFAEAQITIESADMPVPGYHAYISRPDTLFMVDPSIGGPNYDWDFSTMMAISQTTDTFINLATVPFGIRFQFTPAVSVVQYQQTPDDSIGPFSFGDAYNMYETRPGVFINHGSGADVNGIPLALVNNPVDSVYVFPLDYGNTDSTFSQAELDIPGFIYVRQERQRFTEVDGWGTLTTPYGTFNVLRVRAAITGFDTLAFDSIAFGFDRPRQYEYQWLAKEEAVPMMQVSTTTIDSLGGQEFVTGITYVDSMRVFESTGIWDKGPDLKAQIYPNPSEGAFQINWTENLGPDAHLEILDLQGRKLKQINLQGTMARLNLSGLSAGTYLVRIISEKHHYEGKLMIH